MTTTIITTRIDGGTWEAHLTVTGQSPPSGIPPIEGTESAVLIVMSALRQIIPPMPFNEVRAPANSTAVDTNVVA